MFSKLKKKLEEEKGDGVVSGLPAIQHPSSKVVDSEVRRVGFENSQNSIKGSRSDISSICSESERLSNLSFPGSSTDISSLVVEADIKGYDKSNIKGLLGRNQLSDSDLKDAMNLHNRIKDIEKHWTKKLIQAEESWKKKLKEAEKNNITDCEHCKSNVDRAKLIQYKEDMDQLESFQTQEMAKIKHLLLSKENELVECQQKCTKLQQIVTESESKAASLMVELSNLKSNLNSLHSIEDDYNALKHSVNNLQSKYDGGKLMWEEESLRLQDRINTLEKRQKDDNLNHDDYVQSIIAERGALELQIEEYRHELSNIKTLWSEKINSLENQIQHLNAKIAEDSQEMNSLQELISAKTCENKDANEQLAQLKSENCLILDNKSLLESDLKQLQDAHEQMEKEKELQLSSLRKTYDEERQEYLKNADENQKLLIQVKNQLKDSEKKVTEMTETLDRSIAEQDIVKNELEKIKQSLATKEESVRSANNTLLEKADEIRKHCQEKDDFMFRNAEICHELESLKQKLKTLDEERRELEKKHNKTLHLLEEKIQEIALLKSEIEHFQNPNNGEDSESVAALRLDISALEQQLADKNKTIKLQQQRLTDMKKTLQRELRNMTPVADGPLSDSELWEKPVTKSSCNNSYTTLSTSSSKLNSLKTDVVPVSDLCEVNFQYLKHVLFKFLTCKEYEAQHLVRAVSVLLQLSKEEENYLKDTLEWKNSWFGSKPDLSGDMKNRLWKS